MSVPANTGIYQDGNHLSFAYEGTTIATCSPATKCVCGAGSAQTSQPQGDFSDGGAAAAILAVFFGLVFFSWKFLEAGEF